MKKNNPNLDTVLISYMACEAPEMTYKKMASKNSTGLLMVPNTGWFGF